MLLTAGERASRPLPLLPCGRPPLGTARMMVRSVRRPPSDGVLRALPNKPKVAFQAGLLSPLPVIAWTSTALLSPLHTARTADSLVRYPVL